ncbi:MAG: DHH family phosphoesterase [Promethearchaeota archaeon]
MSTSTFSKKLDVLITQAVEYFQTHYVEKYREHSKNVQSQENDDSIGNVHIYSHTDTDGICAASILSIALKRENINYHITILKQLQEKYLKEIAATMHENREFLFFIDFGSGHLNLLAEYLENGKFIILDHHQPLKTQEPLSLSGFHVNSYFAEVNGSSDICGASMAYLFAKKLRKENIDLSSLAVVGAVGDHQNSGEQQSLTGENSAILQDAIDSNQIIQDVEPLLPRTISLPLGLANKLPEGINLFDNDIRKSTFFLKKIGVKHEDGFGHPRFLPDLSASEKRTLTSELVKKFLGENTDNSKTISDLLITHYLLPQFKEYECYDAKDFSKMINACGRLNIPSIGIACCVIRSDEIIKKGLEASKKYSENLQDGVKWLIEKKKFTHFKAIEAFDGEDRISEYLVGVVCTILIDSSEFDKSTEVDTSKPIIGYAHSGVKEYKISGRCSEDVIKKGVDLSQAIRSTCTILGLKAKGGGHPPAAGAFIPKNLMRQFLSQLDQQIRLQLGEKIEDKPTTPEIPKKKTIKQPEKSPVKKKSTQKPAIGKKTKTLTKKKSKGLDNFWG